MEMILCGNCDAFFPADQIRLVRVDGEQVRLCVGHCLRRLRWIDDDAELRRRVACFLVKEAPPEVRMVFLPTVRIRPWLKGCGKSLIPDWRD